MNRSTTVIVHYGDPGPTLALANQVVTFGTEVVVVANDMAARPSGLHAAVEWIVPDRNLGYGQAFAMAVAHHSAMAYVVLNTDITLTRRAFEVCLDRLLDQADVGVVAPVLRHEDGTLQSGAATLSRLRRVPMVLFDPSPQTVDCMWVTGAVMFIRGEVARDIGMDGSYFLGAEDTDLCLRAREAGWRVLCCGEVSATHHGGRVIGRVRWSYYSTRNRVWLVRAHFGWFSAAVTWIWALVQLPRVVLADILKRRSLMSSRLLVMAMAHSFWRKPAAMDGALPGEPIPARVMKW